MPTPGTSGPTQTRSRDPSQPARDLNGAYMQNGRLASLDDSKDVLERSARAWENLEEMRERRRKNRDYLFGDQWGETVTTPDGKQITERQAIENQGREPWEMNRVRPIVRNLKGQFRQNESDRQVFAINREDNQAARVLTQALREARKSNDMSSLEAHQFIEHLLSARSTFRVGYKYIETYGRKEVTVDPVNTLRLFYNPDLNDPRARDLSLIGEIHDMEVAEVVNSFAPRDEELAEAIRDYYGDGKSGWGTPVETGFSRHDGLSFRTPTNTELARVIESWRLESHTRRLVRDHEMQKVFDADQQAMTDEQIRRENEVRKQRGVAELERFSRRERVWVGYYLTPTGEILWSGKTPYDHGEHPFVLGFGDFLDGEARGLMDDLIDQQRLYNRMVQIIDMGMSTSARGVLMIPEEMIPDGMSPQDFADEYQKINGTIVYKATTDQGQPMPTQHTPEQVYSNSIPAGAFEWLGKMNEEMQNASGVRGPLMGETSKSGTPASLYNQQIVQSQLTNLDQFETYFETLHDVDHKIVQVAAQYYPDGRRVRGEGDEGVLEFDEKQIKGLEFDVSIAQVDDTATYRQLWEDDLKQMLGNGLLTFRQYLKVSSHPRADELMELIQRTNPLVAEQNGQPRPSEQAAQNGASQEMQQALRQVEQGSRAASQSQQMSPQARQQLRARLIQEAEENDSRRAQALLNQAA